MELREDTELRQRESELREGAKSRKTDVELREDTELRQRESELREGAKSRKTDVELREDTELRQRESELREGAKSRQTDVELREATELRQLGFELREGAKSRERDIGLREVTEWCQQESEPREVASWRQSKGELREAAQLRKQLEVETRKAQSTREKLDTELMYLRDTKKSLEDETRAVTSRVASYADTPSNIRGEYDFLSRGRGDWSERQVLNTGFVSGRAGSSVNVTPMIHRSLSSTGIPELTLIRSTGSAVAGLTVGSVGRATDSGLGTSDNLLRGGLLPGRVPAVMTVRSPTTCISSAKAQGVDVSASTAEAAAVSIQVKATGGAEALPTVTSQSVVMQEEPLHELIVRLEKALSEIRTKKGEAASSSTMLKMETRSKSPRDRLSSRDTTSCDRRGRVRRRRAIVSSESESDSEAANLTDSASSERKHPHVKGLPEYDGVNMPLKRFLHKFNSCSMHYQWDKECRRFFLDSCLVGVPADIVADGGKMMTEKEIIRELKLRFGSASRNRAYRTQLESLRQSATQSIQDVYNEVTRLLSLSYPGKDIYGDETVESIGCNAFFRALADEELSKNLQVKDPEGLSEALTMALKLEPIYKKEKRTAGVVVSVDESGGKTVRTVEVNEVEAELRAQLKRAQKEATDQRRSAEAWRARAQQNNTTRSTTESSPTQYSHTGAVVQAAVNPQAPKSVLAMGSSEVQGLPILPSSPTVYQQPQYGYANQSGTQMMYYQPYQYSQQQTYQRGYREGRGRARGGNQGRGQGRQFECYNCGEQGHFARECPAVRGGVDEGQLAIKDPEGQIGSVGVDGNQRSGLHNNTSNAKSGDVKRPCFSRENVYARARVNGRVRKVCCDTGSVKNLIPASYVEGMKLEPTEIRLFSASAQPISALGKVELPVVISGVRALTTFIVSDEIGDIILGYEFMRDNKCEWAIGKNEMRIRGKTVRMIKKDGEGACVRRVFVRETVSIPANSSRLIAVRMPYSRAYIHGVDLNLPPVQSNVSWLLESVPLQRERVFTAHSLLPEDDRGAVVSVLNLGDRAYSLYRDRSLGLAGEAVMLGTLMENVSLRGEREIVGSEVRTVSKREHEADASLTESQTEREYIDELMCIDVSDVPPHCETHEKCPCGGLCSNRDEASHVCTDCGYMMLRRSSYAQPVCLTSCEVPRDAYCESERPAVMDCLRSTRRHAVRKSSAGKVWRRKFHAQIRCKRQKSLPCIVEECESSSEEAASDSTCSSSVACADKVNVRSSCSSNLLCALKSSAECVHEYDIPVGKRCEACYDERSVRKRDIGECRNDCVPHMGDSMRCNLCKCDKQSALAAIRGERCEEECVYGSNAHCKRCGNLRYDIKDCDVCPLCHGVMLREVGDDESMVGTNNAPLDLTQRSISNVQARHSESSLTRKKVKFDAHVKTDDYIYCWEHDDCTRVNECICKSVGRICVFNVWDDQCVRCGCDSKPYVDSLGGYGTVNKVCAAGETLSLKSNENDDRKSSSILRGNRTVDVCVNRALDLRVRQPAPSSVSDLSHSSIDNLSRQCNTQPSLDMSARSCVDPYGQQERVNQHKAASVRFAIGTVYAAQAAQASGATVEIARKRSHCSLVERQQLISFVRKFFQGDLAR